MTLVRAFPRIHAGLVDLGNATARRHGGAGFMLNGLPIVVTAESGSRAVAGLERLDRDAQTDVHALLNRIEIDRRFRACRIHIKSLPPQHTGLGTKTALLLAILKACESLTEHRISQEDLQRLSGRGGVSGIGIHGFFVGGFIVDGGHVVARDAEYAPSSSQRGFDIPPLTARAEIPSEWRFVLCRAIGERYAGGSERSFFAEYCPIPQTEVHRTLACVYHELLPAVIEANIHRLKAALEHMHEFGFKRRELGAQSASVRSLFKSLRRIPDCAVGMSSMGPLLFAIVRSDDTDALSAVRTEATRRNAQILGVVRGRNEGFEMA